MSMSESWELTTLPSSGDQRVKKAPEQNFRLRMCRKKAIGSTGVLPEASQERHLAAAAGSGGTQEPSSLTNAQPAAQQTFNVWHINCPAGRRRICGEALC